MADNQLGLQEVEKAHIAPIQFDIESLEGIYDEMQLLTELHWAEIAMYKDEVKLSIDWDAYRDVYSKGLLWIFTARKEGELIGYVIDIVKHHPHYSADIYAVNDIFFVHPDHRRSTVGIRLFKYVEAYYRKMGVSVWAMHTKRHKFVGKFLERLGFEEADIVYTKLLKGS